MTNKTVMILMALFTTLVTQSPAFATDEYNVSTGVTTAGAPLGVHGVDVVALSTLGAVAEGDAMYSVVHDGVAYYFASENTAERFEKKPSAYLPQYGAFCAFAVAKGKKFDGDPHYADIVHDKLYLFVNGEIFQKYLQDRDNILRSAETMWPKIRDKRVGDL